MLSAGAAKTVQRILRHVIAALNRNLFNRIGHVFDRNAQKAFGQIFGRFLRLTGFCGDLFGQLLKQIAHDFWVERLICIRAKDMGKLIRLQFAQKHIAIRHCQRAAAAVTGRAGVCPGAVRADLHTAICKA